MGLGFRVFRVYCDFRMFRALGFFAFRGFKALRPFGFRAFGLRVLGLRGDFRIFKGFGVLWGFGLGSLAFNMFLENV